MRARTRVALVSMAVSASFGLAGCAAIDELKDTILRWVESEKLPDGRGAFADDLPDATPVSHRKSREKGGKQDVEKAGQSARKLQRLQSVVLPPKKPPISDSPRRRGRTKLRGNPRRPLRCDCALLFPKRRRREFFHAEIGQRSYARSVRGRHRAYLCCRLAILSAASKSAPATQQPNDCGARLIAGRRDHGRKSPRRKPPRIERRFHLR